MESVKKDAISIWRYDISQDPCMYIIIYNFLKSISLKLIEIYAHVDQDQGLIWTKLKIQNWKISMFIRFLVILYWPAHTIVIHQQLDVESKGQVSLSEVRDMLVMQRKWFGWMDSHRPG